MNGLWFVGPALMLAFVFSAARSVADLRARRYVWATAGGLCALVTLAGLLTPISTHAVKIDLPR